MEGECNEPISFPDTKTQIAKGNYEGWVDTLEPQCKPKQALQQISFPWYDNLLEKFVAEFTG